MNNEELFNDIIELIESGDVKEEKRVLKKLMKKYNVRT